ncbi:MAG: shikimate dehydrogenase [Rhizobiaceae bacterium]
MTFNAFVTGWPISHSLSPVLHGYWLAAHAIDGTYRAIAKSPNELDGFLKGLDSENLVGGNITIPHKERALELCDVVTPQARAIGAVNTVWLENGQLHGTNTDAYGFLANLDQMAPGWDAARSALVLGAGGAARAVVFALLQRGISKMFIINRSRARAETLAEMNPDCITVHGWESADELACSADLIVNTTSLGMKGQPTLEINLEKADRNLLVTDIVYTPLRTPLIARAQEQSMKTVDGLGMLLHQAVPGFELWFGTRPEVNQALRDHILDEIERRRAHS